MRLFIALNFPDDVKAQIKEIIDIVRLNSVQGRFVSEEHIHLTLEFLGEINEDRVYMIKELMDSLEFENFALEVTKPGYFKSREGKTYWLGLEKNDALFSLRQSLHHGLSDKGFKLEDREYKPHITIGRKVVLKDGSRDEEIKKSMSKILIDINKVDLMKSEFIDGKLVYSILFSKHFSDRNN